MQSKILQFENLQFLKGCLSDLNKMPSGILFSGNGDVGQGLVWREFLREFLGPQVPDPERVEHPDIRLILQPPKSGLASLSREDTISVQTVRDSLEFAALYPLRLPRKVIVLEAAELLTVAAANGLLKTIEDQGSTKSALFIFTSQNPDFMLAPLKSRFQEVKLTPLSWDFLSSLPSPGSQEDKKRAFEGSEGDLSWYNFLLSPDGRTWEARGRRLIEGTLASTLSFEDISSILKSMLSSSKKDSEDEESGDRDSFNLSPEAVEPTLRLLYRFTVQALDSLPQDTSPYLKATKLKKELARLFTLKVKRFSLTWEAAILATFFSLEN